MKLGKLKKKMPEKKGEEMEGMDMEALSGEAESEYEPMEQEMAEESMDMEEAPMAPPADLEALSDEELMAELKKRGLMSQLEEGEEEADEMPMA